MTIPAGFFTTPRYRAIDANGNPISGAKLYFWAAATSTPLTVYSDYLRGTPLGTSVDADTGGLFPAIYVPASAFKVELRTAAGVNVWGPEDHVPGSDYQIAQALLGAAVCQGRLTLSAGVPVTTADVTAATTIRYTPYKGNGIALYDGSAWNLRTFAELSIAVPATTSQMYDVFVYDNAGAPTLELLAWTNDTTRATALTLQDGVLVKTGALTRRYVGSFRTTAVSGQTEDSLTKRFVWNYYHRVPRPLRRSESTATWTYTTLTWRQANAAAANQLAVVVGVAEDPVDIGVLVSAQNTNTAVTVMVSIGEDVTNAPATGVQQQFVNTAIADGPLGLSARLVKVPTAGYHFYSWLEESAATGTTTWYGASGGLVQSGMSGVVQG